MITLRQLVDEVTKLATDCPDNKYISDEYPCMYNSGMCTNGSIGCIFGQACKNLGLKPLEGAGISSNIRKWEGNSSIIDCYEPEISWCNIVQKKQDTNWSWSAALAAANERYPIVNRRNS